MSNASIEFPSGDSYTGPDFTVRAIQSAMFQLFKNGVRYQLRLGRSPKDLGDDANSMVLFIDPSSQPRFAYASGSVPDLREGLVELVEKFAFRALTTGVFDLTLLHDAVDEPDDTGDE